MCVEAFADGVRIALLVVPGASRDAIAGLHGDTLRVRVSAPPEKGRANDAVVALLAAALAVRRGDVRITAGHGNRRKTAEVRGIALDTARRLLGV